MFAQLTLDFTFKKVFASESEQSNKLLVSPIEAFLGEYLQGKIKTIELLPTERKSRSRKQRAAVFDLHCTDNYGNRFIVEMQLAKQNFFMGRLLFYLGITITSIAKKGKNKFDLPRIYSLSFLNFEPEIEAQNKDVVHHIGLTNLKHPEERHSNIHLALVELPKFNKSLNKCKTSLDLWLWLFKNLHTLDKVPARFRKGKFKEVFEIAKISNFTNEELQEYEAKMKEIDVYNATVAYAEEKGEERGFGKGDMHRAFKTARNLKAMGLSVAQIAKATELTRAQVLALK